jgi:hypothetical protein
MRREPRGAKLVVPDEVVEERDARARQNPKLDVQKAVLGSVVPVGKVPSPPTQQTAGVAVISLTEAHSDST